MAAIAPVDIKAQIVGIGPWLTAAAALPSPQTYDDDNITTVIAKVIRKFEQETSFTINPVQIWTHVTRDNPNPYGLYVMREDPYDFNTPDSNEYFRIKLRHHPIYKMQRVRVMFGSLTVYTIPWEWYQIKERAGIFHVITQFGSLAVSSAAAAFALIVAGFGWKDYMSNALAVDYICGLPDANAGNLGAGNGPGDCLNAGMSWYDAPEWQALRLCIEKYAAAEMLKNIANLADAGLRAVSTSGAGASEALEYTRFADKIAELMNDVNEFKATLEDQESLMPMYTV
jgi:hypothetical protein